MREGREVVKNARKKFKEGAVVSTRVLGLDYCAGMAVCSLHKNLLSGIELLLSTTKEFQRSQIFVDLLSHMP